MSKPLYYDDAYLEKFESVISDIDDSDGLKVALESTAFYPGGGGQPSDIGWLIFDDMKLEVAKVSRKGLQIWHHISSVDQTEDAKIGSSVSCQLDWDRRHKIMRTHTAMHILCGVVWHDYGASVTGGNMEAGSGRMDFEFEKMSRDLVEEIEKRCNEEIEASREIKTAFLSREDALTIPDLIRTKVNLIPESVTEIRTVEIVGLDLQADGGTHVRNTSEVKEIKITDYKSKGAINKRIYLSIGD